MRTPDYETASEHATIAYLMARHNGASRDDADRAAVAAWDAMTPTSWGPWQSSRAGS